LARDCRPSGPHFFLYGSIRANHDGGQKSDRSDKSPKEFMFLTSRRSSSDYGRLGGLVIEMADNHTTSRYVWIQGGEQAETGK
jgi:hypothetical protein